MKNIILSAVLLAFAAKALPQCEPATVPFTIDAESATVPFLEECMSSNFSMFTSTALWGTLAGPVAGFAGNVFVYNTATGQGASPDAIVGSTLYTQYVQLDEGAYNVSFKYGGSTPGAVIGNFDVALVNLDDAGNTIPLGTYQNIDIGEPQEVLLSFSAQTAGAYSVRFSVSLAGNQGFLYLDDINVSESDCGSPIQMSVHTITTDSAVVSWSGEVGDEFEYVVLPSGILPDEGTETTNIQVPVDDLQPDTFYTAYVRSSCGDGSWSVWSQVTFPTLQQPLSVTDNAFATFSAYPNPVKNILNVSNAPGIDRVQLYTLTGQLVQSVAVNASQGVINMEQLAQGVYVLNVASGNEIKKIKVVKQ